MSDGHTDDEIESPRESAISTRGRRDDDISIDESTAPEDRELLQFEFRDEVLTAVHDFSISTDLAADAVHSKLFTQWLSNTSKTFGTKRVDLIGVHMKRIDFVDIPSSVEKKIVLIEMEVDCDVIDEDVESECREDDVDNSHRLSTLCILQENTVGLLLQLKCIEDSSTWSILVEQPRIALGAVSALELPTCLLDEDNGYISGPIVDEMESCGITIDPTELVDLSQQAYESKKLSVSNFIGGLHTQPDRSNECIQIMLSTHEVRRQQLQAIRSHMSELNDSGTLVTFRVIPILDMWRVSMDVKVMCALFLLDKLDLSPKTPSLPRMKRSPSFSQKLMNNLNRSPSNISGRFDESKEKVKNTIGNAFSSMKSYVPTR